MQLFVTVENCDSNYHKYFIVLNIFLNLEKFDI